jgi:hypothetical protein
MTGIFSGRFDSSNAGTNWGSSNGRRKFVCQRIDRLLSSRQDDAKRFSASPAGHEKYYLLPSMPPLPFLSSSITTIQTTKSHNNPNSIHNSAPNNTFVEKHAYGYR